MPININTQLPAAATLADEGIFVMPSERAAAQDIRPLRIVILNIMPTKEQTETQLIRLLANSPLQVEIDLLRTATHQPRHTSREYLETFYKTFSDIRDEFYDGMIVTGAPVELLPFEEVNYWDELTEIFDWARKHVYSTMFICWAAQAGLYHNYGIGKRPVGEKLSGVYLHEKAPLYKPLLRGFDDVFWAPHSRYTEVCQEEVAAHPDLEILCSGRDSGIYIVSAHDGREIYVTGHPEYTANTLRDEYVRDIERGLDVPMPANYFTDNDPDRPVQVKWRGHASLLFGNWLNYYVYQETPYDLRSIHAADSTGSRKANG
ncbi:MAG: homoserine O-succinyltransferase [Clostridia bacterium]|nr:homoserine O-succinyltransferase [Clostridia bacterium]